MGEIITLQLGGCGNAVGSYFWEAILGEHGWKKEDGYFDGTPNQLEYINVYFEKSEGITNTNMLRSDNDSSKDDRLRVDVWLYSSQLKITAKTTIANGIIHDRLLLLDRKHKPRAILVDLDICGNIHDILSKEHGSLFKTDNIIFGISATNYNWARGYRTEGAQQRDQILNAVRREAEASNNLQGIQIVHSLGGGTGAGLGSLLAEHMVNEYPKKILRSYAVLSDEIYVRKNVANCYNTMLTIPYLIDCIHEVICIDNRALARICYNLNMEEEYDHMNYLISICMSGITTCLRFPCRFNTNLRDFHVHMVPIEPMHFFVPGHVPLTPANIHYSQMQDIPVNNLIEQIFRRENTLVDCNPDMGRFLSSAAVIRGSYSEESSRIIDQQILQIQTRPHYFIDWFPNNINTNICNILPHNMRISVTSLSNTTAIQELFTNLVKHFQKLFQKKKYVYLYTEEGTEMIDFQNAHETMLFLIQKYQY